MYFISLFCRLLSTHYAGTYSQQGGTFHDLFCTVSLLHEEFFPAYGRVDSLIFLGSGFPEGVK